MAKIMVICPFWGQIGHVGTFRVERLVRWLTDSGNEVVVVNASHQDQTSEDWFGTLISVRDPLKIYPNAGTKSVGEDTRRRPNAFRRWMAYFLLNPDLHIIWSRAVLKSTEVKKYAIDCDFYFASSPPESAFHAAAILANRYDGKFVMDMRDGWLDEPMKPLLRSLWIQKIREARLEKKLVNLATHVTLTSENWRELLARRYPYAKDRITVIPNTYPEFVDEAAVSANIADRIPNPKESYTLVHAGRISSSRPERNADFLLNEIIHHIDRHKVTLQINFIGNLEQDEMNCLEFWKQKFCKSGSELIHIGQVPRNEALKLVSRADGLLMISNSYASIPAKYFDYSVSGKPILCFTTKDSIISDISTKHPQVHVIFDGQSDKNDIVISDFLKSVKNHEKYNRKSLLPEFTESVVKVNFLKLFND